MSSQPRVRKSKIAIIGSLMILLAASCGIDEAVDDFPPETVVNVDTGDSAEAPPPDPECESNGPRKSFEPQDDTLDSSDDLAAIKEDGKPTVGVAQDTLLFGYLNGASGEIEGFDIEIAKLVAEELFGSPDAIELVPVQNSERLPKLVSGEVELVIRTMTINCQRWAEIDFSTVYYEAGQRILVRSDSGVESIADLPSDAKVCAGTGTTSLANLANFDVVPVEVTSVPECLVLFQQSGVDAISTDDTILAALAAQDPFAVVVGDFISEEPYGLGISKENKAFTLYVNAVLEKAREGDADSTWQRLYDEWLADTLGPQTVPSAEYR